MSESIAPLTDRQRIVLAIIVRHHEETGRFPSIRYLSRRLAVDFTTMRGHLEALHRRGWLKAPLPGLPLHPLTMPPSLPIPERCPEDLAEEEEESLAKTETRVLETPSEHVTLEKKTPHGEVKPTSVIVKTGTKTRRMDIIRRDGQITGFKIIEETDGE